MLNNGLRCQGERKQKLLVSVLSLQCPFEKIDNVLQLLQPKAQIDVVYVQCIALLC